MVPIGSVASFEDITGPYRVPRYNLYPAAEVQGSTQPGTSAGEALVVMERLMKRVLPDGFSYEWTELALQEKQQGDAGTLVFIAAVVFVFLALAALYESWLLPLAVILIVEFAEQAEDEGADRFKAAIEAAKTRIRPILMTSFAFILGVVPLVIASGAGAEMRQSLGTAVFFGMLGVTIFGLIFTPVFYVVSRGLGRRGQDTGIGRNRLDVSCQH